MCVCLSVDPTLRGHYNCGAGRQSLLTRFHPHALPRYTEHVLAADIYRLRYLQRVEAVVACTSLHYLHGCPRTTPGTGPYAYRCSAGNKRSPAPSSSSSGRDVTGHRVLSNRGPTAESYAHSPSLTANPPSFLSGRDMFMHVSITS